MAKERGRREIEPDPKVVISKTRPITNKSKI
jgi:hypothetical protein